MTFILTKSFVTAITVCGLVKTWQLKLTADSYVETVGIHCHSFHFASVVGTVVFSQLSASSSTSWSNCNVSSYSVKRQVLTVWFIVCFTFTNGRVDKVLSVQIFKTWTSTCLEVIQQRSRVIRTVETWLQDSRVSYNSVVDHRRQQPFKIM